MSSHNILKSNSRQECISWHEHWYILCISATTTLGSKLSTEAFLMWNQYNNIKPRLEVQSINQSGMPTPITFGAIVAYNDNPNWSICHELEWFWNCIVWINCFLSCRFLKRLVSSIVFQFCIKKRLIDLSLSQFLKMEAKRSSVYNNHSSSSIFTPLGFRVRCRQVD
mgnify:CR=1 FL=1